MGDLVKMVTVVPVELAKDLQEKKRIKNYNALPQLNKNIIVDFLEFMTENNLYEY